MTNLSRLSLRTSGHLFLNVLYVLLLPRTAFLIHHHQFPSKESSQSEVISSPRPCYLAGVVGVLSRPSSAPWAGLLLPSHGVILSENAIFCLLRRE